MTVKTVSLLQDKRLLNWTTLAWGFLIGPTENFFELYCSLRLLLPHLPFWLLFFTRGRPYHCLKNLLTFFSCLHFSSIGNYKSLVYLTLLCCQLFRRFVLIQEMSDNSYFLSLPLVDLRFKIVVNLTSSPFWLCLYLRNKFMK